ncbi:MAG: DUF5671 domain-containing protein [bacterium]|nr:DUF5671 domain-containing protein [bacterium]
MDKPKVTPKDFFLWVGAMVAFYVSIYSFITLLFEYINRAYPDVLNYNYVDPYSGSIRFAIASLLVLFPVFLVIMRFIRGDIAQIPEKRDLWVRRWALFVTVFVAGATVIIDLITLINYFLGGDLTTPFILKVLVVLLVAGGAFLHFIADVRGYWVEFPKRANMLGYAVAVVVLVAIVSGFFIMGSPNALRTYRYDDQKINDLTSIQWQIVNYYQQKEKLPTTLTDLNDSISGYIAPVDVQSKMPYVYETTGTLSFKLCATFNAETQADSNSREMTRAVPAAPMGGKGGGLGLEQSTWKHSVGNVCFDRTIDPELYPPFTKMRVQ